MDAVDDGPVIELVARAEAGGVKLTGDGGLLTELTRKVLDHTLEGRAQRLRRPAHLRTPTAINQPSSTARLHDAVRESATMCPGAAIRLGESS
ncbi:hypothetical protein OHA98_39700 [Streptomyces sp. NBC_00654]|uniref:hypothetical protein n=1 Tax=Streptomyces sp. NBC_00654 TaxID=2975799 RepID=UPI00225473E2|nr:hypothetical protein [Streptomyces sp. NBC_00654]MCX4970758.1 hypothetical protein [Streptomyces sp. NBC_00654]MCX4970771.1 hypothetical protein [Streptomyces sp. NBC_00654]